MTYKNIPELEALVEQRMVSARPHPYLPLKIYNYTVKAVSIPSREWSAALCDARGLILDNYYEIVGRGFRKFWNYSQVQDLILDEPFTVWEKLDGSLGIICSYAGEVVVATRGSFDSMQARWLNEWVKRKMPDLCPSGESYLVEIIYPENRIVVDYRGKQDAILLAVMGTDGVELPAVFEATKRFNKVRRYDGVEDFSIINSDPRFDGEEGFVVKWSSGFMAKVKREEYVRLHRLITQCSTRTIWELLRDGKSPDELIERVPDDFAAWVREHTFSLLDSYASVLREAQSGFDAAPRGVERKVFAEYAKKQKYPALIFSLLDDKRIEQSIWKIVEPKWSTPFRCGGDE